MASFSTWLPYILPIAAFLLLSNLESSFGQGLYPALYTLKIAIVGALLLLFARRKSYPEIEQARRAPHWVLALLSGVILCAAWLLLDRITPHVAFLGRRSSYDPFTAISDPLWRVLFISIRLVGLFAVAPVMEELFFRSFLLRIVIDPVDFRKVPIGMYEPVSCVSAVVLMALGHPEWLAAAVFSLAMNLMIYRTKSVTACILSHTATNLALGVYVLTFHAWSYW